MLSFPRTTWLSAAVVLILAAAAPAVPTEEALAPVREALSKTIRLQLLQVPLGRALEYLQKEAGVAFIVDRAALAGQLAAPIELEVEAITVREALELTLAQVGFEVIDYDVRDGRVFISSPANVIKPHLRTEVYDVRVLTQPIVHFTQHPRVGLWEHGAPQRGGGGGGGQALFRDAEEEEVADVAGVTPDMLMELIQSSVRTGTHNGNWEIAGVSIQYTNGLLVVANTPEAHAAVADLLNKYQQASGKMISINARFLLVPTRALDQFITREAGGALLLSPRASAAFLTMAAEPQQGFRMLGAARTVCFNSQRVNVTAGSETLFVSDLDPVVGTRSVAFDPGIRALANDVVLSVQPTAGVDNQHISMAIIGEIALGDSMRRSLKAGVGGDPGAASPDQANVARSVRVDDALAGLPAFDRPAETTIIELPEQDSVRIHTSARIPNGGAVILSGVSQQFKQFQAQDSEVVLLIQAVVVDSNDVAAAPAPEVNNNPAAIPPPPSTGRPAAKRPVR